MNIKFVNHSSFIIEHGDINLICDPWLDGLAFNNGWKLLSESKMEYADFSKITHIWFSHEHPDHFSPPNLLKIPKDFRKNITVLYQETTDRKVANFCEKTGFKEQIELKENEFLELSKDFSILCNPYTDGDSYALLKIQDYKILNLNDCIVNTERRASDLKDKIGEVDILFTQFGYANKVGNYEDKALRESSSNEKLQRISYQNKFLKPKIIIPFASYIYFCHEENKYMNEGINKIDRVHSFIQNELNTECMVMYPNDSWKPNQKWDSDQAIRKYIDDYNKITTNNFLVTETIEEAELLENSINFIKTIKKGYPKKNRLINSLNSRIFISDYKKMYLLSGKYGLIESNEDYESFDIMLSSESLNYCFKELWGGDTLNVNARFQTYKNYNKFRIFGTIASSLNRKEKFPIPSFFEIVENKVNRLLARVLRQAG